MVLHKKPKRDGKKISEDGVLKRENGLYDLDENARYGWTRNAFGKLLTAT
jgi:hypothetical protein